MSQYITISPSGGTGNGIITATTLQSNISGDNILGTIAITNGIRGKNVAVKQKYQPVMNQFASTTFPASGGNIYFTVKTEYDIVFRSVPNWIRIFNDSTDEEFIQGQRISYSALTANTTFRLTAEANTSSERSVGSTFNMGHYIGNVLQNRVSYFSFRQEGASGPKSITITPLYIEVGSAATSTTVTMNLVNCMFDHMTTSSAGSFTITASTPLHSNITLTFPTNSGSERRGYLTFYLYDTDGNAYTATVTVVQAASYVPPTPSVYTTAITTEVNVQGLSTYYGTFGCYIQLVSEDTYSYSTGFTFYNDGSQYTSLTAHYRDLSTRLQLVLGSDRYATVSVRYGSQTVQTAMQEQGVITIDLWYEDFATLEIDFLVQGT